MSLLSKVVEMSRRVIMVGNVAVQPALTPGGMLYLKMIWERADENGQPLPAILESVRFWKEDALALMAQLNKGDRIKVWAIESIDNSVDKRSEEDKAKYGPRSGFQYAGVDVEILFKKANVEIAAPVKKTRKPRKQA